MIALTQVRRTLGVHFGALVGVSFLLLTTGSLALLPAGAGAPSPSSATLVLSPPFAGSVTHFHDLCLNSGPCHSGSVGTLGCVSASTKGSIPFQLGTGRVNYDARTVASGCAAYSVGNTSTTRYAQASGGFTAALNLTYRSGSPSVYANVSFDDLSAMHFLWGTCTVLGHPNLGYCSQRLETELTGQAWVVDVTANLSFSSTSTFSTILDSAYRDVACTSTSGCSTSAYPSSGSFLNASHNSTFSWKIPLLTGMTKGDRYLLLLDMTVTSSTWAQVHYARLSNFSGGAHLQFFGSSGGVLLPAITET